MSLEQFIQIRLKGFWSILKRGVVGTFHKVSTEFTFGIELWSNNRLVGPLTNFRLVVRIWHLAHERHCATRLKVMCFLGRSVSGQLIPTFQHRTLSDIRTRGAGAVGDLLGRGQISMYYMLNGL